MGRRATEKWGGVYVLIACTALALALYSCSGTPARQRSTPLLPTVASIAPTPIPATSTSQPPPLVRSAATPTMLTPTASRHTPLPTPATPTDQQATPAPPSAPTPTPGFVPLPVDAQFTQITAGKYHACGLQADGTALCWGSNVNGSLNLPAGLEFRQISAGLNFACGLRIDDAIACWGQNAAGQASPPNGRFDEIAAGRAHACALDDGALICWGADFPDSAETIQEVPPLSGIQAGAAFTCGLTPDADMACLNNIDRELAITPGPFTDIGTGLHHACAMKVNGRVFCVSEDVDDASRKSQPPPTKFVQIAGGWQHTCGITILGALECWGIGVPGAPDERLSAPGGKFTAIEIGWRNSCALSPDGYASCWQQRDKEGLSISQHHERLLLQIRQSKTLGEIRFDWPVAILPLPSRDLAIVERAGFIVTYPDQPNAAPPKTMLDIADKTTCCIYEGGILNAALDPQFEEFPFLYVYYTAVSQHAYGENMRGLAIRLARFRVEGGQAVRDSELTILEAPQPHNFHHGGDIRFGADGMLYLGIGDNYSAEKAQSLDTLLGKVIRIDVRGATPEQPYRVPPDNPFVDNPDARPEIWAYGLRNPWRMDFAPDGRLFIADVGRKKYEEVSLAAAGANLGWPLCEGSACKDGVQADDDGLTAPIYTYGRDDGCAIIGGVTTPRLDNGFIFGDYCSKRVWLLEQDEREGWRTRLLAQMEGQILSFGKDADGTVYVLAARNPIMRLQIDGEE